MASASFMASKDSSISCIPLLPLLFLLEKSTTFYIWADLLCQIPVAFLILLGPLVRPGLPEEVYVPVIEHSTEHSLGHVILDRLLIQEEEGMLSPLSPAIPPGPPPLASFHHQWA